MSLLETAAIEILESALSRAVGVIVETPEPDRVKATLWAYIAKSRRLGVTRYDGLSIHLNPRSPETELYVFKSSELERMVGDLNETEPDEGNDQGKS